MSPKRHFKEKIHNDNIYNSSKNVVENNSKIIKYHSRMRSRNIMMRTKLIENLHEKNRDKIEDNHKKMFDLKRDIDKFKLIIEHMISVRQFQDNYYTELIKTSLNDFTLRLPFIHKTCYSDMFLKDYDEIIKLVSTMKANFHHLSMK